jgi:maleylacetoacetate isomerase
MEREEGFLPMKLYGFWRSLATYRVRVALALKKVEAEQVSINLLQGKQHTDEYRAINPQSVVPALVIDDGPPLFQSMAILEYLEETHPQPPLLPKDPRGRARVRGLAQIVVSDGHPLVVPRIRGYLEKEMRQDEPARNKWLAHWTLKALEALESHLAKERETGRFCHGDAPTLADICLASQVLGARFFNVDTAGVPAVVRIFEECMKIDAFDRAQPLKQPDAPKNPSH